MLTQKNIKESTKEVLTAKKIRSNIDHILKQIIDDLIKQKAATDEAFRLRIEETKEIKEKLELQHSEVRDFQTLLQSTYFTNKKK